MALRCGSCLSSLSKNGADSLFLSRTQYIRQHIQATGLVLEVLSIKVYGGTITIFFFFFFFWNTEMLFLTWYCKREETAWLPLCLIYWKSIVNYELRSNELDRLMIHGSFVNEYTNCCTNYHRPLVHMTSRSRDRIPPMFFFSFFRRWWK